MVRGGLKWGTVLLLFSNLSFAGIISKRYPVQSRPSLIVETHQIDPRFFVVKLYDTFDPDRVMQISTAKTRSMATAMEDSFMSWAYYHFVPDTIAEETDESKNSDSEEVVEIVSSTAPKPNKRVRFEFNLDGSE